MVTKLTKYDPAEDLGDSLDQAELVTEALQNGDPELITEALDTVVRARNITQIADTAGVSRQSFYKALADGSDPQVATVVGVAKALGIRLSAAVPAE